MTEESRSSDFYNIALWSASGLLVRRLRSLFVEESFSTACAQVGSYSSTSASYQSAARYAHVFGDIRGSIRRQVASPSVRGRLGSKSRPVKPMQRDQILSVSISLDDASVGPHDASADV